MFHQHFLSATGTDLGPLDSGERVLWQGRCAVAEYGFDEASSLPRWTLPEETDVLVTDRRVRFACATTATVSNGELFWLWPQHLRVQPGNRETGRNATVTQIQLVCTGPEGSFPALVFAGGDVTKVGDADRLANVMRQAIARFRVENAAEIGVPAVQTRMLSRLVIGPEFSNYQGGEGQTVTMLGAVPVPAPEPGYAQPQHREPAYQQQPVSAMPVSGSRPYPQQPVSATPVSGSHPYPQQPVSATPVSGSHPYPQQPVSATPVSGHPYPQQPVSAAPISGNRTYLERPGREADALRAEQAIRAEQDSRYAEPDLASRAATLAARVANLVSNASEDAAGETTNLSAYLSSAPDGESHRRS